MMYASAARELAKKHSEVEKQFNTLLEKCSNAIFESARNGQMTTYIDFEDYDEAVFSLLKEELKDKGYSIHLRGAFKTPRLWIDW